MWTTIALAMTLAGTPGESGELRLSNIRPTHGLLGSERPDSRLLPGDVFFVTFDIDGLKVDDSGTMLYTMSMEVRNASNKIEYKSEPQDLDMPAPLGGHSLPGFAHVDLGRDMAPGDYTLKVTVMDRGAKLKESKYFEKKFEVLPTSEANRPWTSRSPAALSSCRGNSPSLRCSFGCRSTGPANSPSS